jgi:hypothetical protein
MNRARIVPQHRLACRTGRLNLGTYKHPISGDLLGAVLKFVFKLVQLYSAQNIKDMCNLGKFIHLAFKIRDAYVQ